MNELQISSYKKLSSLFYDAVRKFASLDEIQFYSSLIDKDNLLLEAMCGSGRLLIPLLQQGYLAHGVDNSPAMLEQCIKRAALVGLKPLLFEQDIQYLDIAYRYHTVIIVAGSLQLIHDRQLVVQVLKNIRYHMHDVGELFIDTFIPDMTMQESISYSVCVGDQEIIQLTRRTLCDLEKKVSHAFCFYEYIKNNQLQEQEYELLTLTWYADEEFIALLEHAGFEYIAQYEKLFDHEPARIFHARVI